MPVVVAHELLTFNAFGMLTVTPKKIIVNITAISGQRAIKRYISKDLRNPLPETGQKTVAAAFGVWIEPGKRARITVSELATHEVEEKLLDIPDVGRLIEQAVHLIQDSALQS